MRSSRSSWIAIFAGVTLVHVGLIAWLIFYLNPVLISAPEDSGVVYPSITSGVVASGQVQVPEMLTASSPDTKPTSSGQEQELPQLQQEPLNPQDPKPQAVAPETQEAASKTTPESNSDKHPNPVLEKTDKAGLNPQSDMAVAPQSEAQPQPEPEPTREPTPEPTREPTPEPTTESTPDPNPQPVTQTHSKPSPKNGPETTSETDTQPVAPQAQQPSQTQPNTPTDITSRAQAIEPTAVNSNASGVNPDQLILVTQLDYLEDPPNPIYPPRAKQAGQQGKVVLRVTINSNGELESLDVRQSSGVSALDDAAKQAVRRVRFRPYTVNGVAVRAMADIPFDFVLNP